MNCHILGIKVVEQLSELKTPEVWPLDVYRWLRASRWHLSCEWVHHECACVRGCVWECVRLCVWVCVCVCVRLCVLAHQVSMCVHKQKLEVTRGPHECLIKPSSTEVIQIDWHEDLGTFDSCWTRCWPFWINLNWLQGTSSIKNADKMSPFIFFVVSTFV